VIQAIQSSVCKAEAPQNGFPKMGDQKIESLCVSWWSLLLNIFLADSSSCSIDQKKGTLISEIGHLPSYYPFSALL
jgi:hypothetical protein